MLRQGLSRAQINERFDQINSSLERRLRELSAAVRIANEANDWNSARQAYDEMRSLFGFPPDDDAA